MDAWHPRHTTPLQLDSEMYKGLPPTETFFGKRVGFKGIAPRAAKADQSIVAVIHFAPAILGSRRI